MSSWGKKATMADIKADLNRLHGPEANVEYSARMLTAAASNARVRRLTDEQFEDVKAGRLTHFSMGFIPIPLEKLTWWQRMKRWARKVAMLVRRLVRRLAMRVVGWL